MNTPSTDTFLADYEKVCTELATLWFRKQCRNPYQHLYLWYRESIPPRHLGVIMVSDERPGSDFKACPEPFSSAWTHVQARGFIHRSLQRVAILPVEARACLCAYPEIHGHHCSGGDKSELKHIV